MMMKWEASEMGERICDGVAGPWEPLMVSIATRGKQERRELWLVSRGEVDRVKARLSALDGELNQGSAGWWEIDSPRVSVSGEARIQSGCLGWVEALYMMTSEDEKESLEPELGALAELSARGLALGPVSLERRRDCRVFELDAALAGAALMERYEIDREAARSAEESRGPGARLAGRI